MSRSEVVAFQQVAVNHIAVNHMAVIFYSPTAEQDLDEVLEPVVLQDFADFRAEDARMINQDKKAADIKGQNGGRMLAKQRDQLKC